MMTEQEEKYVHFRSCINDLNQAWNLLKIIKTCNTDNPLIGAAFQFALIEYSKPYRTSWGNAVRKHILMDDFVPAEHKGLHRRILDARDQIFAHSDLTVREATLYLAASAEGKKIASIVQNKILRTREFSNIDDIIDLIEKTLDKMYPEEKRLEAALPLSS